MLPPDNSNQVLGAFHQATQRLGPPRRANPVRSDTATAGASTGTGLLTPQALVLAPPFSSLGTSAHQRAGQVRCGSEPQGS